MKFPKEIQLDEQWNVYQCLLDVKNYRFGKVATYELKTVTELTNVDGETVIREAPESK